MIHKFLYLSLFLNILFCLSGCKSDHPEVTKDIPDSYSDKLTEMDSQTGFNYGWIDSEAIKKYDKIIIHTQLSENMLQNSSWEDLNSRRLFFTKEEDDQYVADYCKTALRNAFMLESNEFKLTDTPVKSAIVLDFYIVQIVANKIIVGAVSNAIMPTPIGWMLVPAKLALQYASPNQGGSIAVEIVLTDSITGKIVAVFVSREKGPTAFFDRNRFYAYANIRRIVDIWAIDVVSTLDQIKEGKTNLKAAAIVHDFKLQDRIEKSRMYNRINYLINN